MALELSCSKQAALAVDVSAALASSPSTALAAVYLNVAVREGLIKQPLGLFDPAGFALARSF